MYSRATLWGVTLFTLLSAALSVMFFLQAKKDADQVVSNSRAAAIKAVNENARLVTEKISGLGVADELARDLASGELAYTAIDSRLKTELESTDGISMTVAWLPEAASAFLPLVDDGVVYFKSGVNGRQGLVVQDGYYTRLQTESREHGDISVWYQKALEAKQGVWFSSPYLSPVSKRWWACGYTVPFSVNGSVAGVVAAELTVDQIGQLLFTAESTAFKALPIDASYSMLVSEDGTVFSHPDATVVAEQKSISDFFPDLGDPSAFRASLPVVPETDSHGHPINIYAVEDFKDLHSGQTVSVFLAPVEGTQWWTAIVLDQKAVDRSMGNLGRIKTDAMKIAGAGLAFFFGLILLICRVDRGMHGRLWPAAILTTLICMGGIAWVLSYNLKHSEFYNPGEVVLANRAMPAKALMQYQGKTGSELFTVPTGVFVQSAEFSNANNVTITGFVWQKYDDDLPEWLRATADKEGGGFIFPESEQTNVELRYHRRFDHGWTYGWYFNAVLRQEFDYGKYPFDLENVWIRMWHSEVGRNVVLVPDMGSYKTLVPAKFPGLELQDFVLEGWDVSGTYFSYRLNSYNTNFGIDGYAGSQDFPELYFNVELSRSFLNAFIMNFITLSVAAVLLYAVQFTIRTRKEKLGLLGFNVSGVLGFCAALFFVVILAHTSLRQSLASPTLVYLEYYYFVMYAAFLVVSINAIMVASDTLHSWIRIGDNLVARLLFWPLLSFGLLLTTLVIFN
jgi:hypothetical protein